MQFEPVLNDPDGKTLLPKCIDPALNGEYSLDAVWKVSDLKASLSETKWNRGVYLSQIMINPLLNMMIFRVDVPSRVATARVLLLTKRFLF